MTATQHLTEAIKDAMRARDQVRLDTLRYLSAQVKNAEIDKGLDATLTDEEFIRIVQKILKNSQEAVEQFQQGGRMDLVEAEQVKIDIMKEWLPQTLTDDELRAIVVEIHQANPEVAPGPLTGLVMKAVAGRADGRQVSTMIREVIG